MMKIQIQHHMDIIISGEIISDILRMLQIFQVEHQELGMNEINDHVQLIIMCQPGLNLRQWDLNVNHQKIV